MRQCPILLCVPTICLCLPLARTQLRTATNMHQRDVLASELPCLPKKKSPASPRWKGEKSRGDHRSVRRKAAKSAVLVPTYITSRAFQGQVHRGLVGASANLGWRAREADNKDAAVSVLRHASSRSLAPAMLSRATSFANNQNLVPMFGIIFATHRSNRERYLRSWIRKKTHVEPRAKKRGHKGMFISEH